MSGQELIGSYIQVGRWQSGDDHLTLWLGYGDMDRIPFVMRHKVAIHTANFNYMQLGGTTIVNSRDVGLETRIELSDGTVITENRYGDFEVTLNGGDPAPFFRTLPDLLKGRVLTEVRTDCELPSLSLISAPDLSIHFTGLPSRILPQGCSTEDLEGKEIVAFHQDELIKQITVSLTGGLTLVIDTSDLDSDPEGLTIYLEPQGQKRLLFVGK